MSVITRRGILSSSHSGGTGPTTPMITPIPPQSGVVGTPYTYQLFATNGLSPYTWAAINLPAGLSINPSTGLVSGTPTGTVTITASFTVTDLLGHTSPPVLVLYNITSSSSPVPNAPTTIAGVTVPTTLVFDEEFNQPHLNITKWAPGVYYDNNNGGGAFGWTNTLRQSGLSINANGLNLLFSGTPSAGNACAVSTCPWTSGGPWTAQPSLGIPAGSLPGFVGFTISPSGGGVGGLNPGASGPVYIEYGATGAAGGGGIANWFQLWMVVNFGITLPSNPVIEIDGLESGGVANSTLHYLNYNTPNDPGNYQRNSCPAGVSPATPVFHTWGILWTTTFVAFVLDRIVNPNSGGNPFYYLAAGVGAMNTPPQGLILAHTYGGLALSSPATATVRYVRVFQ